MKILITLCARAGSKGIPGKNTRLLNGKPLLEYSIDAAKKFAKSKNSRITISTDDAAVTDICNKMGIYTDYIRPSELSTDSAGKVDTILDVLLFEEKSSNTKFDYILDLDVTSPLRTIYDLNEAFQIFKTDENALNIFSVNPANRNPYFNMVEKRKSGYYGLVKEGNFLTRQSAIPVFDMNASFYFYKRSFFDMPERKVVNDWSLIYCMPHICFDLDHPIDFEFMTYLIENNKLGFEL